MRLVGQAVPAIAGGEPVRDDFLVFGAPYIGEEEISEVVDTLRSGWIGFGPKCLKFEEEFARYVEAKHAISLGSCTAGLHLALLACGIHRGDEVITTPLTFPATANVIELVGARPVFVDVEATTQNIDVNQVESKITSRTKAIIPVHMAGRPCQMDAISDIASRNNLIVIEDAAHAVEAQWRGRKVGSTSRFAAYSFYATKNLTTAEGGMLTTTDDDAAQLVRTLRLHGISKDAWRRYSANGFSPYDTLQPGFKYNMTDVQASLGLHQLARLEANLGVRKRHWQTYDAAFGDLPAVQVPAPIQAEERHARHLYTLLLHPERLTISRQRFLEALKAENIGAGIHFTPVHLHTYYREKYRFESGSFPNAEDIGSRTVSLPLSAKLSSADVADVISAVRKVVTHYGR